jgi:BatD DUF11 like domain
VIRLAAILSLFIITTVFAQSPMIEAAISSTQASTVEPITYQITTDCDCNIEAPDLSAFDILQRQPGQFTQTSNINGKVTNVCTSTLTFILRPKKKGTINIGKAKAICENEEKASKSFSITVVDADALHSSNEGTASFYYKLISNKNTVFVGEPFTVTMYLFTDKIPEDINNFVRGDALGISRHPLYDIRAPGHVFPQGTAKVKGKQYHVIELSKEVCFADKAGKISISAYYGSAIEQYRVWDNLFMEGYSNSLKMMVKEIPGEKPENYYGMAGEFEITHEISETSIKANRAIDMKVTVSGTGNFHLLRTPEFLFPKDSFLITGPEIEKDLVQMENGAEGSVTYNYIITPTKEGEYLILPYSFAYFDWNEQKMKSVMTHDFVLNVSKGDEVKTWSSSDPNAPIAESDIRYIHSVSGSFFSYGNLYFGRLYHFLLVGGPLGFFFFFFIIKLRKSQRSDEEVLADVQKITKKSTVKEIKKLKSIEGTQGIDELKKSLEEYLMMNLNIGRSLLSKKSVVQLLTETQVTAETTLAFEAIWDKLEMAQYAPMSSENIQDLVQQTEKLIQSLNKQI